MNVYQNCPFFVTPSFTMRLVRREDAPGLLKVYSCKQAQHYFNCDDCTSDFRYSTLEEMEQCIDFWLASYARGDFVRWTILDDRKRPVGTVEMFRRNDADNGTGVLRIDLHSSLETIDVIDELLCGLLPAMHELFGCECILTKSTPSMVQRNTALARHSFYAHTQPHYWARRHKLA